MKILHLSDVHYRPADADLALASLRVVRETAEREHVDLVAFSGDMFDRAIHNSEAARLPDLIDEWTRIDSFCPIVGITGTPTHDVAGSYHAIVRACDNHGFTLLEPGTPLFLHDGTVGESRDGGKYIGDGRLLILGCPEPSKEWFLADKNGLGREQAAEAVTAGMRQLLLGLGAIRKEHADLPCLMLYHGAVAGASLANGQALPPGGIQIGREDLALVGADYYALGHIHAAQQIGDLPAFYAGSAYPCNWGETDQKGCYLVDFTGERVDAWHRSLLTHIDFPHAPRRKVVLDIMDPFHVEDVRGFQAWVVQRVPSDIPFDPDTLIEAVNEAALPGSRVTVEIIPTETVRAGDIQAAASLGDKLRIYAENSGEQIPPGTAGKVEQLEAEARAEGSAPAGQHIRIDRLRLRGAIGIWKGQGVDEIELDLGTYDDGLISLLGPNGAGKTTLIENLHPFPSMLTRDGKLQDHFRLRDSYRDLHWTDVRTGDTYRALIQIDAQAGCDYHLYRNGEPIVTGRKADYEAKIAELFGSLPLYLRSAFVTQRASRGAPELSEATKGERKALFRELGGLDYLQGYADLAKGHRQQLETALVADQREIEILERDVAGGADLPAEMETRRASLVAARQRVAGVEAEGKAARERADAAAARLKSHLAAETELNGLRNQVVGLGHERGDLEGSIKALQRAKDQRPALEKQISNWETLKAEEETLNGRRTDVLLERERLTAQHGHALEAHRAQQREVEKRQRGIEDEATELAREKDRQVDAVDRLVERLQHRVTCPSCGHQWALGGADDQAALEAAQQRVLDIDIDLVRLEAHAKAAAEEFAALIAPPAPELPVYDEEPLAAVRDELAGYDIRALRAGLEQATTADAKIAAARARIEAIGQQVMLLQVKIAAAEGRLDPKAFDDDAAARKLVDSLATQWREAHGAVTGLEAEIKALEAQIAEIERKRALLAETRERVVARETDAAAWRWLERACGPDGIQALELDAMGPGIAAVANRILEAAYGSRFAIEFRTTRIGGKGAKTKQIEDFQIIVHDSERGGEQPIETLSGGESVWVKRALYDAFGIIRDRATGQRFLTVMQDEADGALDPEARVAYIRMLEAAHAESGRRHTILITHSETVQQMIGQRIDMAALARAREGAAA